MNPPSFHDPENDLPSRVAFLTKFVRPARLLKGEDGVDDRPYVPSIHQLGDLRKLRSVRSGKDILAAHAVGGSGLG